MARDCVPAMQLHFIILMATAKTSSSDLCNVPSKVRLVTSHMHIHRVSTVSD